MSRQCPWTLSKRLSSNNKYYSIFENLTFIGGACRVCGDVTHLKKDCPQYQAQQRKEESSIMLETLGSNNPETLESTKHNTFINTKKQNKIIKFV